MKLFIATLMVLFMITTQAVDREKELCFLSDTRYDMKHYQKKFERNQLATVKKVIPTQEKASFDIFLPENTLKVNQFKRAYIPNSYILFSEDYLKGMKDYVKNGGLLITASGLCVLDKNKDFKYNKGDSLQRHKGGIAGAVKFSTVKIKTINVETSCPLTKGLLVGKPLQVDLFSGRTHNISAEVIVSGDALFEQKTRLKNMPIVTYKKIGKGAIIFMDFPGENDIFLINALSPLTLEWLVDSE